MIFRKMDPRDAGLPYSTSQTYTTTSLDSAVPELSGLKTKWTMMLRRAAESSGLSPGYIALIVILVIVLLANMALVGFLFYRRRTRRATRTPVPFMKNRETRRNRSWQPYGSEWFGRKLAGEDEQSLVASYPSHMPSITISRPISNNTVVGPTPIFNTKDRESLHSVGIMELADSSQSSPEAIYDPYTRSRSRSNSFGGSLQSAPPSGTNSPHNYRTRSRNSSISSTHSQSNSNIRSGRPLAQNSYSYARSRSSSNGPSLASTHRTTTILTETAEEYNLKSPNSHPSTISSPSSSTSSPISSTSRSLRTKSSREKSLPPPPPLPSLTITTPSSPSSFSPHKDNLSSTPLDANNWHGDPYTSYCQAKPQFDFADYEVLHETTQVIDIVIAEPLDIPQGPLTPFGEREAKAGAALGLRSDWYKSPSPQSEERGAWLV